MSTGTGPDEAHAFADYVRGRGPALVRFAYLLTADWSLAEDLAQEALISAHLKWQRIQGMDHPDAYVRRAVLRRFLSWRRLKSSTERVSGPDLRDAVSICDDTEAVAERDAMWRELAKLPRRQRAVLVLRFYEDLSDEDIGRLLGCSSSTVRVHLARGLATLRDQIPAPALEGGRAHD